MSRHAVLFSRDALHDLADICDYVAAHDSAASAAHVLERIQDVVDSLETQPLRGSPVRELLTLGGEQYRQLLFKPYRIIYCVNAESIDVLLIVDGRRDLRSLLERRLLGAE